MMSTFATCCLDMLPKDYLIRTVRGLPSKNKFSCVFVQMMLHILLRENSREWLWEIKKTTQAFANFLKLCV